MTDQYGFCHSPHVKADAFSTKCAEYVVKLTLSSKEKASLSSASEFHLHYVDHLAS